MTSNLSMLTIKAGLQAVRTSRQPVPQSIPINSPSSRFEGAPLISDKQVADKVWISRNKKTLFTLLGDHPAISEPTGTRGASVAGYLAIVAGQGRCVKAHVKHPWRLALLLSLALLGACGTGHGARQITERQATAQAMFKERCKTAGEKIYKTVEGVEGVYLMKLRPKGTNFGDQFKLDDPYGRDLDGDGYIESLVRGSYQAGKENLIRPAGSPPRIGYLYVEALDPKDGRRYRYTGRTEEPWQSNKSYLKGYTRFVLDKNLATGPALRYGVTYDDISTREEREYWIAGSSLKVIDLQTGEVIAERIGYMVDWAQGSQADGRSPWLLAANQACPDFHRLVSPIYREPGSSAQIWQTLDFVEKVLKPSK